MAPRVGELGRYRRPRLGDPAVRRLLVRLDVQDATAADLGGTMSLNVAVPSVGGVLRVHAPFESGARLRELRALRAHLAGRGLSVGVPLPLDGRALRRVGDGWAELETFVDHHKPPPTWDSYVWMYEAMGRLHRHLAAATGHLRRPVVSTYGPPGSVRRWLAATEAVVGGDTEAVALAAWAGRLLRELTRLWVPAKLLPRQVVHGDIRLGNIGRAGTGDPAYLDFGFAAHRPRVHDLAYSLLWIVLRPDDSGRPEEFGWERVAELVAAYEHGAGDVLSADETTALAPYLASVALYLASVAAFTPSPAQTLRGEAASLRIAEWVLSHPRELAAASAARGPGLSQ